VGRKKKLQQTGRKQTETQKLGETKNQWVAKGKKCLISVVLLFCGFFSGFVCFSVRVIFPPPEDFH
jgi:hypothetical protein